MLVLNANGGRGPADRQACDVLWHGTSFAAIHGTHQRFRDGSIGRIDVPVFAVRRDIVVAQTPGAIQTGVNESMAASINMLARFNTGPRSTQGISPDG